jgi:hypothetical protein
MSTIQLRPLAEPFVVAPPGGARVRTRLRVSDDDAIVLEAVGRHLGSLANKDLAQRCREGRLSAKDGLASRTKRTQSLTAPSSYRWANTITRSTDDQWQLAYRNLLAERNTLQRRVREIHRRLLLPVGAGHRRSRGYASASIHFAKRQRLQILEARLVEVERKIVAGQVSVCRGGAHLAKVHHNLELAGLSEGQWRGRWETERLFIHANGEAAQLLGNLTIRWNPDQRWCEIKLPKPLEHMANRPGGRYRLDCSVDFPHRGDEVATQTMSGSVMYEIKKDATKGRWYLDAAWKISAPEFPPTLEQLRASPVLAVDLNQGHLAYCVLDASGNPVGAPQTAVLELEGHSTSTRDGRLREAISELLHVATNHGCWSILIEDLDFTESRELGREETGRRKAKVRGSKKRRALGALPTAKFRDRLVQMATNAGLSVVAVDPANTSKWGAEHWLGVLKEISPNANGHHAAALVIGRRGLGHRARRRGRCDSTRPVDREERATNSAVQGVASSIRKQGLRKAEGQSHSRQKTPTGERAGPSKQGTQDRSASPVRHQLVRDVQER